MSDDVPTGDAGAIPPDEKRDLDEWKRQTKAIERVISVALTLDQPRPIKWIAEESCVADQTARDHLDLLGELGIVASTSAQGVTKYHADQAYLRFRDVARLVERYDRKELLDQKQSLAEHEEAAREEFEATGPQELLDRAADAEMSTKEMRTLRQAASEWESLKHRLDLFEDAYREYEKHGGNAAQTA